MILGVSRLATVRAIVLAKHSPKRNVGADELVVRLYLSLVDRPIALAPKIVGLAIDDLGGNHSSAEMYSLRSKLDDLGGLVWPSGFQ